MHAHKKIAHILVVRKGEYTWVYMHLFVSILIIYIYLKEKNISLP